MKDMNDRFYESLLELGECNVVPNMKWKLFWADHKRIIWYTWTSKHPTTPCSTHFCDRIHSWNRSVSSLAVGIRDPIAILHHDKLDNETDRASNYINPIENTNQIAEKLWDIARSCRKRLKRRAIVIQERWLAVNCIQLVQDRLDMLDKHSSQSEK